MPKPKLKAKLALVASVVAVVGYFLIKELSFKETVTMEGVLESKGFVVLSPPSNLVPPGSWVSVVGENPLHLNVICGPENALGLTEDDLLKVSESSDMDFESTLGRDYSVSARLLARLEGEGGFAGLDNITFSLTNVRVVEIPDDTVINGLRERVPHCRDAIVFRLESGQPITMIKSVLMADVVYEFSFERNINSETELQVAKKFALEMGLRLDDSQGGSSRVVGRNLIWGVREDSGLAKLGLGLTSTGGSGDGVEVLADRGEVARITRAEPARSSLEPIIKHEVGPLRQTLPMGCWATVYAMMRSWREGSPIEVGDAVASLGEPWESYYLKDSGLPGGEEIAFVNSAGMIAKPPANYMLEAYVEMLEDFGPLWVVIGDGISSHALLLVGIYGDMANLYDDSSFEFVDPLTGGFRYFSGLNFAKIFEAEVRWIVDTDLDVDLRYQVLHWPSRK